MQPERDLPMTLSGPAQTRKGPAPAMSGAGGGSGAIHKIRRGARPCPRPTARAANAPQAFNPP